MTKRQKKIIAARCAGNTRRLAELEAQEARRKYIEKIDSKGTGAMPHPPTAEELKAMGFLPPVLDQGNSGASVGFAAATAFEMARRVQSSSPPGLSPWYVYSMVLDRHKTLLDDVRRTLYPEPKE